MRNQLLVTLLVALTAGNAVAQIGINASPGQKPRLDAEIYTRNSAVMQPKYRVTTADPAQYVINNGSGPFITPTCSAK